MVCHAKPDPTEVGSTASPAMFSSTYARHLVSMMNLGLVSVLSLTYWLRCTTRVPISFIPTARREMERVSKRVCGEVKDLTRGGGWDFEVHLAVLLRHVSQILFERTTWYLHQKYPDRYEPAALNVPSDPIVIAVADELRAEIAQLKADCDRIQLDSRFRSWMNGKLQGYQEVLARLDANYTAPTD